MAGIMLLVGSAGQGSSAEEPSPAVYKHPKLHTILANLSSAVPQEQGPWRPGRRAEMPPGFALESMPKPVRDAAHSGMLRINDHGEVQVYVLVTSTDESALAALKSAGATIEIVDGVNRMVQARLPMARLEAVGASPVVRFVTLPNYGFPRTGSVETQGDSIIKSSDVRATYHVDGTGVKVGAISDGLKGIFAACPTPDTSCTVSGVTGGPISTGDLPAATGTRNSGGTLTSVTGGITAESFSANMDLEGLPPAGCGFPGAGAEGTALLEILHDIAPGAQLYFANFDTSMAFEQAVNFIASKVDVGMDDIGFFGLPYDGTSPVSANTAAQLNSSGNPIRAWVTAVGNNAVNHYVGNYLDSHVDGTKIVGAAGDLQLFQGSSTTTDVLNLGPTVNDKVNLPPDAEIVAVLTWNDPFGASSNDYDLFLVQESTGTVVAKSTNPQTGTQDPVEFFDYTVPAGTAQGLYDIVIQNVGNKALVRKLNVFAFTPECAKAAIAPIASGRYEAHNYNTPATSISAESDAGGSPVSVVAVGAICSGVPQCPDYPNDPNHTQIEFFSSRGPTTDGRTKPDVTGIDGVSITGAGDFENPFFGTSAATPHAAGADALFLQLAPCLLNGSTGAIADTTARQSLHGLLVANADPLGSPVPNDTYGSGRVDALTAALKEIPTFSAPAAQTVSSGGGTLQATGADPNNCPLTYSWTGTCGAGTGSMPAPDCTPGANTVNLSASNNGVTFTPATTIKVTATSFAVTASPASASVTAGQSATYTISVSPQMGAFSSAVALACSSAGLPSMSTCAFSPASITPGAKAASSKLTISTTAAGSGARWRTPWRELLRDDPWLWQILSAALLGLIVMGLAWKRGREGRARLIPARFAFIFLPAVMAVLLGYAACGGGGGSSQAAAPPPNPGTPSGTYMVTITGTFGQLSKSATVTLKVQ
ncbi:MAG TPA: S8 family serine peptidase [Terriglobia bacterium]|nr:S8 family serine peptidase [Terriglobia bacterium]